MFVTAYDEYAVAAFEEGAVDYVLKPVTAERIAKVVARLKARLAQRRRPTSPRCSRSSRARDDGAGPLAGSARRSATRCR